MQDRHPVLYFNARRELGIGCHPCALLLPSLIRAMEGIKGEIRQNDEEE